jgi:hypothetical protein
MEKWVEFGRAANIDCVFNFLRAGDYVMLKAIKMEVKPEEIIEAVRRMNKKERDTFLEYLLASTSPDYLKSIKEARADYKAGRVKSHEEVFGR